MYSVDIYSDDNRLAGNVEYHAGTYPVSHVARIWDIRNNSGNILIKVKSFGNYKLAEDWLLDQLECSLFTLLSK